MRTTRRLIVIIVAIFQLGHSSSAHALDAIVYIISGGPVSMGGSEGDSYGSFLRATKSHLQGREVYYNRMHNSEQGAICNDILTHKQAHPEAHIVVAGHSFGADAAMWVARCLLQQSVFIDMLLSFDTVQRDISSVSQATTVPENVRLNFHFYQQRDGMIRGLGPNHRQDQSTRGIYSYKQNHGTSSIMAHLDLLKHLNSYDVGPTLAALGALGTNETETLATARPVLERYFAQFPVEP